MIDNDTLFGSALMGHSGVVAFWRGGVEGDPVTLASAGRSAGLSRLGEWSLKARLDLCIRKKTS